MDVPKRAVGLVILLIIGAGPVLPAVAQQRAPLPSEQHASTRPPSAVAVETLPSVDAAALRAEDRVRSDRVGPYRYGKTIETNFSPDRDGTWEQLSSGEWLWRLRIRSRDAVSLSAAFTQFQLPAGAALYLHGPGDTAVHGPYTAADATAGQHWTPLIRGEELILELVVPADRRSGVRLKIGKTVYGYRSLPGRGNAVPSKSGSCNLDVACEEADPWRVQVRSVGRYTFESNGSTFLCSGALINNTAEDGTPYFMTAEHCISTPEEATTMVFYWNYQNETCRPLGSPENGSVTDDDLGEQTSSGAVLRARLGNWHQSDQISGKPDLALVEVDDEIPEAYNLYLSGWSRAGTASTESVTIHHPQGHGKRISFDEDPSSITAYGQNSGGNTHLRIGNWELGTTERGSSGGPLYDTDQHVIGVLSGGFAGCGEGDPSEDNDEPDWYGRLAPGFENGDYDGTTFADVLDPENTGQTTLNGRRQCEPDQIPPTTIDDLTVDSVGVTSMNLQWTAPGEDKNEGMATAYEIRFSTSPITSETDFQAAREVQKSFSPRPAGTNQQAKVDGLTPDSTYYFAIRARDCNGNTSSIGTTPSGTFLPDQVPPAPIPNVQLTDISTSPPAVTLSWTATGDDGTRGTSSRYNLWYDTTPIQTAADTQSARRIVRSDAAPAGQRQSASIEDSDQLQQGKTYYFAVVAEDNAGNQSPLAAPDRKAVLTKDIEIGKGGVAAGRGSSLSETRFVLNETQEVRVELYDLLGRRVRVLLDGKKIQEGFEQVVQFRTNSLSSGPYFLRFRGERFTVTRKIVVVN